MIDHNPLVNKPLKSSVGIFRQAIADRDFLITAEVSPPKGCDPMPMLQQTKTLKDRVHAVNITDSSRAVMSMSPVVASVILQQQLGIETVCQIACRDRNRIALQGDLLGAAAMGITNVLALTGDPVKVGDSPQARSVFDYESVRLLQLIQGLNRGIDANGKSLPHGGTDFLAGAAIDPQSPSWSGLQQRFERKINAGAQFFQSQLITDFERLDKFVQQVANQSDKPILAGIFLIKSAKNALFLNKYVPGVQIPEHIIERLARAEVPLQEGIAIAAEQIKIAKQICQGVHIMAIKAEHLIPDILDLAGIEAIAKP
jgi:methylenetetrahydrofolate reductase (NADPH)